MSIIGVGCGRAGWVAVKEYFTISWGKEVDQIIEKVKNICLLTGKFVLGIDIGRGDDLNL